MRAKKVTYEERQLMAIYNPGTRRGLLKALIDMQQYLSKEERDLNDLTASAISKLQERERMVIDLRYYRGLTQDKTAKILGVSQVQVSRIEKKALTHLRELMT